MVTYSRQALVCLFLTFFFTNHLFAVDVPDPDNCSDAMTLQSLTPYGEDAPDPQLNPERYLPGVLKIDLHQFSEDKAGSEPMEGGALVACLPEIGVCFRRFSNTLGKLYGPLQAAKASSSESWATLSEDEPISQLKIPQSFDFIDPDTNERIQNEICDYETKILFRSFSPEGLYGPSYGTTYRHGAVGRLISYRRMCAVYSVEEGFILEEQDGPENRCNIPVTLTIPSGTSLCKASSLLSGSPELMEGTEVQICVTPTITDMNITDAVDDETGERFLLDTLSSFETTITDISENEAVGLCPDSPDMKLTTIVNILQDGPREHLYQMNDLNSWSEGETIEVEGNSSTVPVRGGGYFNLDQRKDGPMGCVLIKSLEIPSDVPDREQCFAELLDLVAPVWLRNEEKGTDIRLATSLRAQVNQDGVVVFSRDALSTFINAYAGSEFDASSLLLAASEACGWSDFRLWLTDQEGSDPVEVLDGLLENAVLSKSRQGAPADYDDACYPVASVLAGEIDIPEDKCTCLTLGGTDAPSGDPTGDGLDPLCVPDPEPEVTPNPSPTETPPPGGGPCDGGGVEPTESDTALTGFLQQLLAFKKAPRTKKLRRYFKEGKEYRAKKRGEGLTTPRLLNRLLKNLRRGVKKGRRRVAKRPFKNTQRIAEKLLIELQNSDDITVRCAVLG